MNSRSETASPLIGLPAALQRCLSPVQSRACQRLHRVLRVAPVAALMGSPGSGKTTLARQLVAEHGAVRISMNEVVAEAARHDAAAWEEAVRRVILDALDQADVVVLDDYDALTVVGGSSGTHAHYFSFIVMRHVFEQVAVRGKRLVLVGLPPSKWQSAADLYGDMAASVQIEPFGAEDYRAIATDMLGARKVAAIDFTLVYRYAGLLNGHQLRSCFSLLADTPDLNVDAVIDCLAEFVVASNTRMQEIEALSFDQLPGSEHIVQALETHIVLPLENRALAQKMGLKPKRGVLLYGPPGTGKTSIGRALAHRMKGKFFLIDGSFISEPPTTFFQKVQKVVNEAKQNSPSVLFIDDADVLFRIEHIAGLARYLLSLLDGLESETASHVCVMMTAMDVRKIPEALLRSGRVELWLETRSPDAGTRAKILQRWMGTDLPEYDGVDYRMLAAATERFTPADLRRITGDAKSLYAADLVRGEASKSATQYLKQAVDEVVRVRARMAAALGDDRLRVGAARQSGYGSGAGSAAAMGTCEAGGW